MPKSKDGNKNNILTFPGNKNSEEVTSDKLEERLQEQLDMIRQDPCACECLVQSLIEQLVEHGIIEEGEPIHPRLLTWALGVSAGFIVADHMSGFMGGESSGLLDVTAGVYEGIAITAESAEEDHED